MGIIGVLLQCGEGYICGVNKPKISQALVSAHLLGGETWLQGEGEEEAVRSYS